MNREPIFIAENTREAENVERVLDEAGVSYSMRLDALPREGGACFQGILYEVAADDADRCRRLMLVEGLSRGLLKPVPHGQ
jgi:hypothetical protein